MTKVLVATSPGRAIALLQRAQAIALHSPAHSLLTYSLNRDGTRPRRQLTLTRPSTLNTAYHLLRDIHIRIPVGSHTSLALSSGSAHLRRRYAVHRLHLAVIPCNFLDLTKVVGATSASVTTFTSDLRPPCVH